MYHDAERRKEAAEINASLYALRECVRYRRMQREAEAGAGPTAHVHVPYRSSQLTRVLMECFVKEQASVSRAPITSQLLQIARLLLPTRSQLFPASHWSLQGCNRNRTTTIPQPLTSFLLKLANFANLP